MAASTKTDEGVTASERAALRATRLPLGVTAAYAAGAAIDGVMSNALNVFILFYLTSVCGVPAASAGVALAVGLGVDAVADPLLGALSDGWQSKLGRRLPPMLCGLPIALVSFALIFSLPARLGGVGQIGVIAILSIALRTSVSLFNLPYLAVGAELSDDHHVRSRIMTWRWGFSMLGALAAIALGFGLFFRGPNGIARAAAYPWFALTLDVVALLAAVVAMAAISATRGRQHLPNRRERPLVRGLYEEFREVFASRSFRVLFAGAILFFISQGVTLSLGLHANRYFWRLDAGETEQVTLAFFVGLLVGAPLAGPIVKRMERRAALFIGICGLALAQGGPATLRLLGLLPLDGAPLAWLLAGVLAGGGALMSMAAIAFMSMMADAADEHEQLYGSRREGLYFAGWAFAGKAAHGAGTLISGLVLQLIRFPSGTGEVDPAELAPRTVEALGFFYGPAAAALAVLGTLVLRWYRLDRAAHRSVLAELHARRRGATVEQAAAALGQ